MTPLQKLTRRALLAQAGRLGLGAAAIPLAQWLAACGEAPSSSSSTSSRATPSATPAPATPEPTPTPDTRPISIVITGDIMLGRSVNTEIVAGSDRFPFDYTADYLRSFDITVGNLECVVSSLGQPIPGKDYTFRGDPKSFERLSSAGFSIVSLANNHSGDYGKGAYTDMLAQLPAHGLTPLGGGLTLAKAHEPVIRRVRSTTVGLLAYCEIGPLSFAATATSPGHAWLDPALMQSDITAVRPHVDYLITFMHWGIEYQGTQSGHQQAIARQAIEAGADFVVGSHPHVVQPSETYAGKPIVYSLGNFVFDQMYSADVRRGNVLAITVAGAQLLEWKLRPSYITGNFGEPQWL